MTPACAPLAVLDTNVLLDWLVFRGADGLQLGEAVAAGRLRWVASQAMEDEMAEVLRRGLGPRWPVRADDCRAAWRAHALLLAQPASSAALPRCRDGDDQKFIDFAVAHRVPWLFTHDRALLVLRRRLAPHGLAVLTPRAWLAGMGGVVA